MRNDQQSQKTPRKPETPKQPKPMTPKEVPARQKSANLSNALPPQLPADLPFNEEFVAQQ